MRRYGNGIENEIILIKMLDFKKILKIHVEKEIMVKSRYFLNTVYFNVAYCSHTVEKCMKNV